MKDFPSLKKKTKKYTKAKPSKVKVSLPQKAEIVVPKKSAFTNDPEKKSSKFNKKIRLKVSRPKIKLPQKLPKLPLQKVKKHDSDFQLILFPLILLIILLTLDVVNKQMSATVAQEQMTASDINTPLHPYPIIQQAEAPVITAKAAIIVDSDSQVIVYAKNQDLRFSMASTTKIMTALTSLDHYSQDSILTVKRPHVDGSGLGLAMGEQFHYSDLLYAMMLPSANDAAQTIADNYPGGANAFIAKMNEKAQSLHLSNTHFSDAMGLDDDGDYTTVVDMSRLASRAIQNPIFAQVVDTKYKTISDISGTMHYPLTNLNELLGTNGVTGIKTGTTEGAGEVLVTSTVKDGHTYIVVVMYSTNRFADTSVLLNYIQNNVTHVVPSIPGK